MCVSWSAKKKDVAVRSSAESEYRSLANLATDVVWLQAMCKEIGIPVAAPYKFWCENSSAIGLASNLVFHARTKHTEIYVHYVRGKVLDKTVICAYC